MHQSGTHWLKHMLACAMARHFNIAPPQFNHANDIIGGPRDPVVHEQIPRILSSHSIAHPWLRSSTLARALALPPYVVLVRDLRASLISNYVKWQHRYQMPFSDFLSGDPDGRRFNSDIWWTIRFLNAWGRVYQSRPEHVTVVRYEALRADPEAELARVVAAFGLPLSAEDINHGINMSGKQEMAAKDDPDKPAGAAWLAGRAASAAKVPAVAKLHNQVDTQRYRYIDMLVATSATQQQFLIEHDVAPSRTRVIPNFTRLPMVDAHNATP